MTLRERETVNCQVESFYSRGDCAEILGRKKMSRVWQMSRSCRDIVIIWAMSKLRMSGCAEDNFGQTQIRGSGIERMTQADWPCQVPGGIQVAQQGKLRRKIKGKRWHIEEIDIILRAIIKTDFYVQFWKILHSKDDRCLCWDMIGDIIHHVIPITLSLITTNSLYSALLRSCSNTLLHNSEFDRELTFDMIVQNGN